MAGGSTARSIDEYLAGVPAETRQVLEELRAITTEAAPGAVETISYAIPTFDLYGKHLVHFAGFRNHVGFYPTPSGIAAFTDEHAAFESAKGSVRFPLTRPLPRDLIRRVVEFRVGETAGEAQEPSHAEAPVPDIGSRP